MRYVGLDVHQLMSAICNLDEYGKKEKQFIVRGRWTKLAEVLQEIPRPFAGCYEASNGYGFLSDILSRMCDKVVVAHPGQLGLIFRSKRKNDRVDAEKLAKLLFLDEVPPVYVPRLNIREWRDMITFRCHLVRDQTSVKNRLRALLRTHGMEARISLWSKKGLAWLEQLTWPSEEAALRCDLLLDGLAHHRDRIKRVEHHLASIAKSHPGVVLSMSIPGVGIRTAEALVAWIDQPARFAKIHHQRRGRRPCRQTERRPLRRNFTAPAPRDRRLTVTAPVHR